VRGVVFFCGVSLMVLAGHGLCADVETREARRELSQQQRQDEPQLRLQQNSRAPSPKLDLQRPQAVREFELQERQQQLLFDQHEVQQQELHARQERKMRFEAGPDARNDLRRFARERQQQLQRFDWDRQQLRQSFSSEAPRAVDFFGIKTPSDAITRLRAPVLAFFGTDDDVGSQEELDLLKSAMARQAGAPPLTTALIRGADHMYSGQEQQVADVIARWAMNLGTARTPAR